MQKIFSSTVPLTVVILPKCIHASRFNTVLYYFSLTLLLGSIFLHLRFPIFDSSGYFVYIYTLIYTILFIVYFNLFTNRIFIKMLALSLLWCPFITIALFVLLQIFDVLYNVNASVTVIQFCVVSLITVFDFLLLRAARNYLLVHSKIDISLLIIPFMACKNGMIVIYAYEAFPICLIIFGLL